MTDISTLTEFLDRLDDAEIQYTLSSVREGSITVGIDVPEEHWEVEFSDDGDVGVEIFKSDGQIFDFSIVEDLFEDQEES